MRLFPIAGSSLSLMASLIANAASGQTLAPSFSSYLASHGGAIVSLETTKTLPNGLQAVFRGTGFTITPDGLVMTAAHVVDGIDRETLGVPHRPSVPSLAQYSVRGTLGIVAGPARELSVVTIDDLRDVAILKFTARADYPHFRLASGKGLRPPDQVVALGFPAGTTSIIPAVGKITDTHRTDGRWLIDAPVNPGHSGGPVVRKDGAVVGIVHAGIQGVTLMNLMLPLSEKDQILSGTPAVQTTVQWPPVTDGAVQSDVPPVDMPALGSCGDRREELEDPEKRLYWLCAEVRVPRGVTEHIEKTRFLRLSIPASAAIVDLRYFHRSRGDYRNPVENGPWTLNLPDTDLQWMSIERADVFRAGDDHIVQALCRNWSHSLTMSCAIGVRYRVDAWLW